MALYCPRCETQLCGVEYVATGQDYDGVSEWRCPTCRYRRGRWSGRELEDGMIERRHGGEPVRGEIYPNPEGD